MSTPLRSQWLPDIFPHSCACHIRVDGRSCFPSPQDKDRSEVSLTTRGAGLFGRACKALGQPAKSASIAEDAANLRGVLVEKLAEMSVRYGWHPSSNVVLSALRASAAELLLLCLGKTASPVNTLV